MKKKKKNQEGDQKKISVLLEDLSSLESYISDLFTFLPAPICFISPMGVILEFNPAFEKISGYKFYEIIGEGIEKIFEENRVQALTREALEKGEIAGREVRLLTKKKKEIPVSVFARARKDKKGKAVGLFIGVFNLSETKKAAQELQEKIEDLEKFQRLAVGRELKMVELKEEISRLKTLLSSKTISNKPGQVLKVEDRFV